MKSSSNSNSSSSVNSIFLKAFIVKWEFLDIEIKSKEVSSFTNEIIDLFSYLSSSLSNSFGLIKKVIIVSFNNGNFKVDVDKELLLSEIKKHAPFDMFNISVENNTWLLIIIFFKYPLSYIPWLQFMLNERVFSVKGNVEYFKFISSSSVSVFDKIKEKDIINIINLIKFF